MVYISTLALLPLALKAAGAVYGRSQPYATNPSQAAAEP